MTEPKITCQSCATEIKLAEFLAAIRGTRAILLLIVASVAFSLPAASQTPRSADMDRPHGSRRRVF